MHARSTVITCAAMLACLAALGTGIQPQPAPQPVRRPQPVIDSSCAAGTQRAYYASGSYLRAVEQAVERAREIVVGAPAAEDGERLAIVMDIDETALSMWPLLEESNFCLQSERLHHYFLAAKAPAIEPVREVFTMARAKQLEVFFITSRTPPYREATEKNLKVQGYDGYADIFLRPLEWEGDGASFKTHARRQIQDRGYRILLNIGDQLGDLRGGFAEHEVLVPNPFYVTR